jgi:hypothetical protein
MKKHFIRNILPLMGILIFSLSASSQGLSEETVKIGRTLGLIDAFYVDTTNLNVLAEKAIVEMLRNLDPHSTYISTEKGKRINLILQSYAIRSLYTVWMHLICLIKKRVILNLTNLLQPPKKSSQMQ